MTFLFDDFFADPDASVEIRPRLWQNGQLIEVPMQVRRRLSLAAREKIKTDAVTYQVNTLTNDVTPVIDQEKLTVLSLLALIVAWPFQYKEGSPVPINEKTVRALGSNGADAIMLEFAKLDQQKAAEQVPFDGASEAA